MNGNQISASHQIITSSIRTICRSKMICLAAMVLTWFCSTSAHAQVTPLADTYTNRSDATTNYGANALLSVDGASETSYIQFPLTSIPAGSTVSAATLKLYVNAVTTAGSFNVDYVNGSWTEGALTYDTAPVLGGAIASSVSVTTADKNQYILINVTAAVQAWLDGSQTNDGLALVANGSFNTSFDSKENTTTSHPPELDIAYAGGIGTITGVTTASGSGLTGGGTSGTLTLGLIKTCASNQVLQWSGSTWACASAGTGTITGVTAGAALTGGGTSGKVTLNVDTTKIPQLATANTFTGTQTVNGNLSATGVVTGSSYQIANSVFAFGSVATGSAFLGFAGNFNASNVFNTGAGYYALQQITTGTQNTAVGAEALKYNGAGNDNTGVGFSALQSNTGFSNTATGSQALYSNTTGTDNDAFGYQALYTNTTGTENTAIGQNAMFSNTSGNYNTAVGAIAMYDNASGSSNTAIGYAALDGNNSSTGNENTASGYQALAVNVSGSDNTGDGTETLRYNSTGADNTASGAYALFSNTTGPYNTATGYQTLYNNTTANYNTATGTQALYNSTTGEANLADGALALYSNTTGAGNTGVGANALYSQTTTNYATCVGYSCTASDNITNATAIGAHARVGASNSLVLGGTGAYAVKVGIGTETPSNILTVAQGAGHPVSDSWETYSSRRWKTNIQPLRGALGVVEQLRGVSYDLKASGKHEIGVIAEEVGAVVPEVVTYEENGQDARSVDYSRLTALLIEAVKQQQELIRQQQSQIKTQQSRMEAQQTQIARLASQVKTIQTTLKSKGQTGSQIQTAKEQLLISRQ